MIRVYKTKFFFLEKFSLSSHWAIYRADLAVYYKILKEFVMSYSLEHKCYGSQECTHADKCIDRYFIDNAIQNIHVLDRERGHLGAGIVKIECQNFEPKDG
jgi:hypothetical protein